MKHYKLAKNGESKIVRKLMECHTLQWDGWEYVGMVEV